MSNTFNYGSLYLDQNTKPLTTDERELAKAFAYFNKNVNRRSLQTDFQKTNDAIRDGRHPVSETAFIKVGSFMMRKLQDTFYEERVKKYHLMGAIAFFADYIKMYKAKRSHPQNLRFSQEFEKVIAKWNQDWATTWNDNTRHFNSIPDSELINLAEKSKSAFAKSEVYPNFFARLLEIRQSYEARKDWKGAAKTAKLAVDLYPASDTANTYYAISIIILGNKEEARIFLKKAARINNGGIASARVLNQIAFGLAGIKVESAIDWLQIVTEIYPEEAVLYNTIGDFYQRQGQRELAIDSYKKAVAIDPEFKLAKESLKKLIM
jgi:tetratricopeptide (TPR) repeat protein